MSWNLWLDDQLDDPVAPDRHTPPGFLGAKSTEEAKALIALHGLPKFMDLDHDLGGDDTAEIFVKWMYYEYGAEVPPEYRIHSANGPGSLVLRSFLDSWARSTKA